ncbi:protein shisa-4-like isoform X1 [Acipenser ruthenus]|uniref:protein shisa-4-like isoform X1 n=2 Tax=Acipenser ruthenus TaxID=7906 RepID=UPI00145B8DC6|nr:protein shisa-4-like isoform X1 [Acipenser ruthenus]
MYFYTTKMSRVDGLVWSLLVTALSACQVSAEEDCLWHVDKNGTWHNGFDCPLVSFCCGNCHRRHCCLDPFQMITEKQQKHCMLFQFSPTTIAGIASSILLFMVIISTLVCCFMCSCCYLYQRWQQMRTPHQGQHIQMTSYPRDFTYPAQGKPAGGPGDPYPGAQHYHPATMPPHYPSAAPPAPYPPADQGYGYGVAAPPPYPPPQYSGL